jgi:mRNA interferase RelE/StbE
MAEYKRYFTKLAEKDLNKLDTKLGFKILEKIKELSESPRPQGSKKLKTTDYYRLRVGDYRVVYEIDDSNESITVYKIRHRKDVYR